MVNASTRLCLVAMHQVLETLMELFREVWRLMPIRKYGSIGCLRLQTSILRWAPIYLYSLSITAHFFRSRRRRLAGLRRQASLQQQRPPLSHHSMQTTIAKRPSAMMETSWRLFPRGIWYLLSVTQTAILSSSPTMLLRTPLSRALIRRTLFRG